MAAAFDGPTFSRVSGAALLMFLSGLTSGCYTSVPMVSAPVPGQVLVMDLNDRGRVALGPSIGASAATIEGELKSRVDSSYVVSVLGVSYLNGQSNRWTNEPLTIQSDLIRELREKKFSRSRTALAAGIGVGAVVAFIASRALLGSGSDPRQPGDGEGGAGQ